MKQGVGMSRYLITGGSGYLGSVLTEQLASHDHEITIYDIADPHVSLPGNCVFLRADICDERYFRPAIRDSDAIIHLAGIVGYPACDADPARAWQVNVDATKILARHAGNRLIIFASTQSVYDPEVEVCDESTIMVPPTLYAETKAVSEGLLSTTNLITLRFATGFGVSPKMRDSLLINDFVKTAISRGTLEVYQSDFRRCFAHVSDMARSIIFALEHSEKMAHQAFNVGDESLNLTKGEIASAVADKTGCSLKVTGGADKEKRNHFVRYDKIHEAGFYAETTLATGIDELVRHYGEKSAYLSLLYDKIHKVGSLPTNLEDGLQELID